MNAYANHSVGTVNDTVSAACKEANDARDR